MTPVNHADGSSWLFLLVALLTAAAGCGAGRPAPGEVEMRSGYLCQAGFIQALPLTPACTLDVFLSETECAAANHPTTEGLCSSQLLELAPALRWGARVVLAGRYVETEVCQAVRKDPGVPPSCAS
jgi:hypothetical protein